MAIKDLKPAAQSSGPDASSVFILRAIVNFKNLENQLASGDDLRVMRLPANTLIQSGTLRILTGEGASETIDIGTTQNGTDIKSNYNIQTAATGTWSATSTNVAGPTSDGHVWINADAAITAAKIEITLNCVLVTNAMVGSS